MQQTQQWILCTFLGPNQTPFPRTYLAPTTVVTQPGDFSRAYLVAHSRTQTVQPSPVRPIVFLTIYVLPKLTLLLSHCSATMVAGPTDAHVVRDDPVAGHLQNDCAVSDGLAACTIIVSDANGVITAFATETVHPFEVQVVATPPPAGISQTQGGSPRIVTISTGSAAPVQLTGTGTGATGNAEPEQTDKPNANGTMGLRVGSMLTVTVLGLVGFALVTLL